MWRRYCPMLWYTRRGIMILCLFCQDGLHTIIDRRSNLSHVLLDIQGNPKNRKLPFFRLSICKIIHAGRVGQFPIFGYSLYDIQGKPEHRKLPYSRMSICNTIPTGRMGSFLFSGILCMIYTTILGTHRESWCDDDIVQCYDTHVVATWLSVCFVKMGFIPLLIDAQTCHMFCLTYDIYNRPWNTQRIMTWRRYGPMLWYTRRGIMLLCLFCQDGLHTIMDRRSNMSHVHVGRRNNRVHVVE
jgi:hypothetical protein